jgi:hypothetical protein
MSGKDNIPLNFNGSFPLAFKSCIYYSMLEDSYEK